MEGKSIEKTPEALSDLGGSTKGTVVSTPL